MPWLSSAPPAEGEAAFNATELTALTHLPPLALVALAAALAAALAIGTVATRGAPSRVRVGLFLLRATLLLGVFALLLEPGLRRMATSREPNRVVLALDVSSSMEQDDGTQQSRRQRAVAAAQALAEDLEGRDAPFVIEWVGFDDAARPLSTEDRTNLATSAHQAEGKQTRLAAALEAAVAEDGTARPLGGVVLFTDGADTTGLTPSLTPEVRRTLAALGAPVHGVLVGEPDRFRDIALERVITDDFAFVRNPVKFQVVVRHTGFENLDVNLTLKENGRLVQVSTCHLGEGRETPCELEFEPKSAGKQIYTVQAPVHPDEAIAENNRIDFTLKVIRDRIRVLQVAGRPSWDERFVRRLLKENPSVDLISFFILRSPTDNAGADSRELSLIPFPTRELFTEELHTFDVVILQDFNYRPYQMGLYLRNIRDFVQESGGGLMMIGGSLSFSEGEYDGTPIAEVLPVELFPGSGHLSEESFRPLLTKAGRTHPVTDLGDLAPGANPYDELPPLEGVNLVPGLAPGAEALLAHPFLNAGAEPHPVVAVREVGAGRSLAILTDSTWAWSLPHVGRGGRGDVHRRFFANALRWLIRDPELSRAKISADRAVTEPGTDVVLEVRTYDPSYGPQGDTDVQIEFLALEGPGAGPREPSPPGVPPLPGAPVAPDGASSIAGRTGKDGTAHFRFKPPSAGAWQVKVTATADGRSIGSDTDAFVVRSAEAETLFAEPREDTLRALATSSLGRVVGPEDAASLELVDHQIERVHRQRTEPLWNQAAVIVLLVLLAGAEWWWRRRRGFA